MSYEEIIAAALALPPEVRTRLTQQLIQSLDAEEQARIDELWLEEAEKRDREIEDGKVTVISGEEVMERMRLRYKR